MKGQLRGFIAGILTIALAMSLLSSASALVGKMNIDVDYTNIKVKLNGEQLALTDASGAPVEPFAYNGTTYLPVRAISNALGLDVDWEQSTSSVLLASKFSNDSTEASNFDIAYATHALRSMRAYDLLYSFIDTISLAENAITLAVSDEFDSRRLNDTKYVDYCKEMLARAQERIDYLVANTEIYIKALRDLSSLEENTNYLTDGIASAVTYLQAAVANVETMMNCYSDTSVVYDNAFYASIDNRSAAMDLCRELGSFCVGMSFLWYTETLDVLDLLNAATK